MKQAPCRALQGQHPRQHPPTAAAASPSLASLASFACLPRACNLLHQSFVDFCPPDSSQVQPISPAHDLEVLVPCPSSSLVSRLSPLVSRLSSLRLSGSPSLRALYPRFPSPVILRRLFKGASTTQGALQPFASSTSSRRLPSVSVPPAEPPPCRASRADTQTWEAALTYSGEPRRP